MGGLLTIISRVRVGYEMAQPRVGYNYLMIQFLIININDLI